MKKTLLLTLFIISSSAYSQKKSRIFNGKVIDSTDVVINAHVINLNSKQGTFSNEYGLFSISGKENDSLQITSIGYKTKILILKTFHFREKQNLIFIRNTTYILDEITLKRTDLTGSLSLDIKKRPRNYKQEAVDKLLKEIKALDYSEIAKMKVGVGEMHLAKPAVVSLPNTYQGLGFTSSGKPSKDKQKSLINILEQEDENLVKIYNLLGEDYFSNELKIPKEKHKAFIDYCQNKGIIKLYEKNNILKLIEVIKKESVLFLKI